MTRTRLETMILALVASLGIFTATSQAQTKPAPQATASTQQVPAEYQAGIAQLRVAKGYLEKAGDKWCGYRTGAIRYIDRAFEALGVSPESTPSEMSTGNVDEPGMMNNGVASLQAAKADFEKAGSGWGGRKVNGLNNINQALEQTQKGITCAKEHKTY
jgi:hypothetical protein